MKMNVEKRVDSVERRHRGLDLHLELGELLYRLVDDEKRRQHRHDV